ncbi:MAG: hypothetical protein HYX75_24175 [Acidobacteria bacterium]|nr:hypothetical protein [Acidobacteriota bacterium]
MITVGRGHAGTIDILEKEAAHVRHREDRGPCGERFTRRSVAECATKVAAILFVCSLHPADLDARNESRPRIDGDGTCLAEIVDGDSSLPVTETSSTDSGSFADAGSLSWPEGQKPSTTRYWASAAGGVKNYWNLFKPPNKWNKTSKTIDVFSLHVNYLTYDRPDVKNGMKQAVKFVSKKGLLLNVEAGGLRPFSGCDSMAGENHAALEWENMSKWIALGGHINLITMDSAINTMMKNGDWGNCGWTIPKVANELADYMKSIRQHLPDVEFGIIEPVPWYSVGQYPNHPGANYGDFPTVLDTVLAVLEERGEELQFVYADSPYEYNESTVTQGWKKLAELENYVHSVGLRFGLVFNSGVGGETSGKLFYEHVMAGWPKYQAVGGNPDEIGVWSWYPNPKQNIPETKPYTFTYTCKKFFQQVDSSWTAAE